MTFHALLPLIAGGVAIGAAAALLLVVTGRIAGISGIIADTLHMPLAAPWRSAFLMGLVVPAFYLVTTRYEARFDVSTAVLAVAGLLVGIGTDRGSGCTSGHGVCGIANLSRRSIVATLLFMGAAMVTVFITRHVLGAA